MPKWNETIKAVRIEDGHQGYRGKVQPFHHHLRTYQHINRARMNAGHLRLKATLGAGRVSI